MMTKITRKEFEDMPIENGRDLWNTSKLCRIAFSKFPMAERIEYSLTTGLWATVNYTTLSGERLSGRIYESESNKY